MHVVQKNRPQELDMQEMENPDNIYLLGD